MNITRLSSCLAVAAAALAAAAEPVPALLVVQNHAGAEYRAPLSNLSSRLSAALSGDVFEVIDPGDAVGDFQNVAPGGETMPLSSAARLAETLGAKVLLVASVDDVSVVGTAGVVRQLSAVMTLQAKRVPSGAGVKGVTVTAVSRKYTNEEFAANADAAYSQLVTGLCRDATARFLPAVAQLKWADAPAKVNVAFACNYPGADVSIDGVSYGTAGTVGGAPLRVQATPGVHNLAVTFPFAEPYRVRAVFSENSSFMVTLAPTAEGLRRSRDDAYFAELLDRARKSGDTDDFCRTEKAKGYAKYLSSSHTRIEGMPETISTWNWGDGEAGPAIGLGLDVK